MGEKGISTHGIRVLVVDDHPLTLSGLASLVRRHSDMELCGEAATAEAALELATSTRPHVIVMDLRLRGGVQNGIELASTLTALLPESHVLVYSGYLAYSGIQELLGSGVAGFVSKTAHPDEVALAIRTVASGDRFISSEGDTLLASIPGQRNDVARTASLTRRELLAVQLLAEGCENEEIAQRLSLSPSSVRLTLTSAFAKLGARNRTDAVVKAHRTRVITID